MNAECDMVHQIWETVKDSLPSSKRAEISLSLVKVFEEYGLDHRQLNGLLDDDVDIHLVRAYESVYGDDTDDEEEYDYEKEEE